MVSVEVRPMGERALLADVAGLDDVLALHTALAAEVPPGVIDLVPAARTVLVTVDPAVLSLSAAEAWIVRAAAEARADGVAEGPLVEVPVRYDGADLADTARLLGISPEALVAQHRAAAWRVAFTGFAPGFAYLVAADWSFDVPRLAAPRTRVPAGAVGLAGGFSGAYPRETPGGWRLIATTDAVLFDPAGDGSVLLPPGARVRFVDAAPAPVVAAPPVARASGAAPGLRVVAPGLFATVQDLGRGGRAARGIARSGALDRAALRRGNRLLGTPEDAAGIEVVLGGFAAVAETDLWVAVTGAAGAGTVDGRPLDRNVATPWPAGSELRLDWFTAGTRAYVSVRGGIAVPPVAGARATDVLAGLGPAPLASGDRLPVGSASATPIPPSDIAPWNAPAVGDLDVELAPGPRADWFTPAAWRTLFDTVWTVGTDADRVGMRLDGPVLARVRTDELPSEGMVPGALQVPPHGRPTILLADGPVTGGYPVIAVATDVALDALGQAGPGTRLHFRRARRRA